MRKYCEAWKSWLTPDLWINFFWLTINKMLKTISLRHVLKSWWIKSQTLCWAHLCSADSETVQTHEGFSLFSAHAFFLMNETFSKLCHSEPAGTKSTAAKPERLCGFLPSDYAYFPNQNCHTASRLHADTSAGLARGRKWKTETQRGKCQKRLKKDKSLSHLHGNHRKRALKSLKNNAWPPLTPPLLQFTECRMECMYMVMFFRPTSHQGSSASARVSSMTSPLERWSAWPKPTGGGGMP